MQTVYPHACNFLSINERAPLIRNYFYICGSWCWIVSRVGVFLVFVFSVYSCFFFLFFFVLFLFSQMELFPRAKRRHVLMSCSFFFGDLFYTYRYFRQEHPWYAIPYEAPSRTQASQYFHVNGIPRLIVFNGSTGAIVCSNAVGQALNSTTLDQWENMWNDVEKKGIYLIINNNTHKKVQEKWKMKQLEYWIHVCVRILNTKI